LWLAIARRQRNVRSASTASTTSALLIRMAPAYFAAGKYGRLG
jgi:hypothetical protein